MNDWRHPVFKPARRARHASMHAILIVRRMYAGRGYIYIEAQSHDLRPVDLPVLRNVTEARVRDMLYGEEIVLSFSLNDPTHPSGDGHSALHTLNHTRVYLVNSSMTAMRRLPTYFPPGTFKMYCVDEIRQLFEHRDYALSISHISVNSFLQAAEQFGRLNLYLSVPVPRTRTPTQYYRQVKLGRFYNWIRDGRCAFPGLEDIQEITSRMQAITLMGEPQFATVGPAEICSICLSPNTDRMLVCGHGFHAKCLEDMAGYFTKHIPERVLTCPYCRGRWQVAMAVK
jgi:hypothetical protein